MKGMQDTGFPGGSVKKNLPANVGDMCLSPGSGKILWRRKWKSNPVFLLGKSPWTEEPGWATVPGVPKSQTQLSKFLFIFTLVDKTVR